MTETYLLMGTTHVVAALVWLGGMLFFVLIAPLFRPISMV